MERERKILTTTAFLAILGSVYIIAFQSTHNYSYPQIITQSSDPVRNSDILPPRSNYFISDNCTHVSPENSNAIYLALEPIITNNMWQQLDISGNDTNTSIIRIWKAHFDTRQKVRHKLKVRILANYDITGIEIKKKNLTCQFWDGNFMTSCQSITISRSLAGRKVGIPGKNIIPFVFSCDYHRYFQSKLPTHVSVTSGCGAPSNKIIINHPLKGSLQTYGLCAPIMYDNLTGKEAVALIEWIEYYRYMGVKGIHLYGLNLQQSKDVATVIDSYSATWNLTFEEVTPPPPISVTASGWVNKLLVIHNALTDCFLQYQNIYQYIAVVDLDDMIVPKAKNLKFKDLFPPKSPWPVYLTVSLDYFLDFGPQQNLASPLIMSKYTKTTGHGVMHKEAKKVKPLIATKECLIPWQHGCRTPIEGSKIRRVSLPNTTVVAHHYRRSCSEKYIVNNNSSKFDAERYNLCKRFLDVNIVDKSALHYSNKILSNVNDKILKLNLNASRTF